MTGNCCDEFTIEMTIYGSSRFTLRSCTVCQCRSWSIDGEDASIDEVVAGLRAQKRRRRRAA